MKKISYTFLLSLCLLFTFTLKVNAFPVFKNADEPVVNKIVVERIARDVVVIPLPPVEEIQICGGGNFKSYMLASAITDHSSQQYQFKNNSMHADSTGLLRLNEDSKYIGVALGSYFGAIGSKYKFTFDTGSIMYAVKVEQKSDRHTTNGCVHNSDGSIIEFLITKQAYTSYPDLRRWGSFHYLPQFKGDIIKIERN